MRSVKGRWGEIWFYGKDQYVGRSLYNYGEFSGEECEKILELAKGKCLDIGANIGAISQMLAANGFEVIAFEPQPAIFNLLQKNFSGEAYNCGLGDKEYLAAMPRLRYEDRNNFGGISLDTTGILGHISVPVKRLDSFNFEDIGFIKLDVEGYEEKVLRGGEELIKKYKPILYVEDDREEKSLSLRTYIRSLGYNIEEHSPPLYRKNNFFKLEKNIWDRNYVSHNIICTPC